jgi:hypothetical protein
MIGLGLVLLALWLACEICLRDLEQARTPPPDPYRLDRWKDRGAD